MPDWFPHTVAEVVKFPPIRIAFLIIVALVLRKIVLKLIDRAVRRAARERPNGNGGRREQRLSALGSLAGSIITVIVVFVCAVMVLAEMGFDITSVIAGTSIVGVTVAFGLQNVVKDFAAGIFMLIEDQLGVGDVVNMKEASGTVEAIGLRVTQLRADDGTVWYVRNGEVVRVGNYSQGGPGAVPEPVPETLKVQLDPAA